MPVKVAFQGASGAYSEIAARHYFTQKSLKLIPCRDFRDVFKKVRAKSVNFGIVPVENSLAGSIHQNYDHLLDYKVWISGERKLAIRHHLIANPGVRLTDVRTVYSHPQALAQCEGFLRGLKRVEAQPFFDTAGSVRFVKEGGQRDIAAIGSREVADTLGMRVLKAKIEDDPSNYTRFVIVGAPKPPPALSVPTKTSIVFALKNIPGGLHKALSVFAIRDIDLLKIESRPIAGSPWKYLFYLDFAGNMREERCGKAVDHLGEISKVIRVLGSYPICSH